MIDEVIVHIGMHKTGSTSIQESLANFDDGITFYAKLEYANHSIPIFTAFSSEFLDYPIWKRYGYSQSIKVGLRNKFKKTFTEQLQVKNRKKMIISAEDISLLSEKDAENFIDYIRQYSKNVKIICYIRDPLSFAASAFQESCKVGRSQNPNIIDPRYKYRIEKFINVVGEENIIVKKFEKDNLERSSVVADFCEIVGIDYNGIREIKSNESLTEEALKVIYVFNKNNPLFYGDEVLRNARRRLNDEINKAFYGGNKIDKNYFYEYACFKDLEYLDKRFSINFESIDGMNKNDRVGLKEWLDDLSKIRIECLLNILNNYGISGDFKNVPSIVNRIFYYLIFLEQTKVTENNKLLADADADILRDVALKFENKQEISKGEAVKLMGLAARARPGGAVINKKLVEWKGI